METTLRQFGNSLGVVIPKVLRESLALYAGQTVQLEQTDQGLLLKAAPKKYHLHDLLAQCDANASVPADLPAWESAAGTDNEVW